MQELKVRAYFDENDLSIKSPLKGMQYFEIWPARSVGLQDILYAAAVMLWTGKQDKNGKDIYDGDILRCKGYNQKYVVKWDNDSSAYCIETYPLIDENRKYFFLQFIGMEFEVIGNIYENSDLIEIINA